MQEDLLHIENKLKHLLVRVSEARQGEARQQTQLRAPKIGDRVRIRILGTGQVEGTIVAITARRLRIKPDRTTDTVPRAPKNATLIEQNDGATRPATTGTDANPPATGATLRGSAMPRH